MQNFKERLLKIEQQITKESVNYSLLPLVPESQMNSSGRNREICRHSLSMSVFLAAEISLQTEIREGSSQIRKNIEELRKHLLVLCHGGAVAPSCATDWEDSEAASLAGDLLSAMGCSDENLRNCSGGRIRAAEFGNLDQNLLNLLPEILDCCLRNDLLPEGIHFLENLQKMSARRNGRWFHRGLTVDFMSMLVEHGPQAGIDMGREAEPWFQNTDDRLRCLYEWNMAACFLHLDRGQEAVPHLKACREFSSVAGREGLWLSTKAELYLKQLSLTRKHSEKTISEIQKILTSLREGACEDADPGDLMRVEATGLWFLLNHGMNFGILSRMKKELDRFSELAISVMGEKTSPAVENFRAGVYLEQGDNLSAIQSLQNAMEGACGPGPFAGPSEALLLGNLLHCCNSVHDREKSREIYQQLLGKRNREHWEPYCFYRNAGILRETELLWGIPEERRSLDSSMLLSKCVEDLQQDRLTECTEVQAVILLLSLLFEKISAGDFSGISREKIRGICLDIEDKYQGYGLSERQRIQLYLIMAYAELENGRWKPWMDRLTGAVTPSGGDFYIQVMAMAADFYDRAGDPIRCRQAAADTLKEMTSYWHRNTACLDDRRLSAMLSMSQFRLRSLYGFFRKTDSDRELYEKVLQFKDLTALAARERNRILSLKTADSGLRERIRKLQDQQAARSQNFVPGGAEDSACDRELSDLQAEFFRKFPQSYAFSEISLKKLGENLHPGELIFEYFISLHSGEESARRELDLYLVRKDAQEKLQIKRIPIPEAETVFNQAQRFMEALQNPEDLLLSLSREPLRYELYQKLLAPGKSWVQDANMVYLSPDGELLNLPFEILCPEEGIPFAEQVPVCRLICGRNLIFRDCRKVGSGGSFILGDPWFGPERKPPEGERAESGDRVVPLPFSGMEARRIADRLKTQPVLGKQATKPAFLRAMPKEIVHLATHGCFDLSLESDALYTSCLVFAGYHAAEIGNRESSVWGNGLLTADEISRMDLRGTRMVVLSACRSGVSDVSMGTSQGLVSAFSAAGVQWVITHLWSADDFAAAVLMDLFYEQYLDEKMSVPGALQNARQKVKNITVQDLRDLGWFCNRNTPEEAKVWLRQLACRNPAQKPFEDERFWGGFTAYRC